MKIISIENKIYRIRNDDYENLVYSISNNSNKSNKIFHLRLDNIIENYNPILILDNSFNF